MKKIILCGITIILLLSIFCVPVIANSPAPADHLTIEFTNIPDNAVYADLLIKIDENDKNYSEINSSNLYENSFSQTSQIVSYNKDGYRSFTFHYDNSKSTIKLYSFYNGSTDETKYSYADFCDGVGYNEYLTQYEDLLTNYRLVKIALLDEQGDIISISAEISLPKKSNWFNFYGTIRYDVMNEHIVVDNTLNPYYIVFAGFTWITLLLFSAGLEVVTAIAFKFRGKQLNIIAIVNVVTQFIMRILYLILPFTYLTSTIILEVFVYSGEFLIYKKLLKNEKTSKIMIFTIIANSISLLFGIWFLN